MTQFKVQHDSMGDVEVPANVYYQAQTQRAHDNFTFSNRPMDSAIIDALIDIKAAAAHANKELRQLPESIANAIIEACTQAKSLDKKQHFPLDVFQTGSGTSSNMNVNEVISTLASEKSSLQIHPNDHVNMAQSSNDVIPTAIQMASVTTLQALYKQLEALTERLRNLAQQHQQTVKNGRTHLMDAMPVTLSQELTSWQQQLIAAQNALKFSQQELCRLPLGGTAVGSGINAHPDFARLCVKYLQQSDHSLWENAPHPALLMSAQDHQLRLMSALKSLAVALLKISNDLRWMNSGPIGGLQEIQLQALQPGSSIMPGKVNPVIPEAVAMIAAEVIGNETTVTVAAQSGNFQLNVMLPIIGDKTLSSIRLLSNAMESLTNKVFQQFRVNTQSMLQTVARNPVLATALNGEIGYEKAAVIAKRADKEGKTVKQIALEETNLSEQQLDKLLDPLHLAHPY
ncbi:class II fumarate hydratase [Neptunicella marina]|uniref:Aspartate ammonia-lyase n=1 Tax=Neptunicella marina TaxID=2125989 RepID=A0A8J6LV86_9ALTE|nr:lyase family protein [Neptunicella marina]MBC3764424.1 aspartate ammonia-lyase [Neptunicella marina]